MALFNTSIPFVLAVQLEFKVYLHLSYSTTYEDMPFVKSKLTICVEHLRNHAWPRKHIHLNFPPKIVRNLTKCPTKQINFIVYNVVAQ